jgi:hypothetical protein
MTMRTNSSRRIFERGQFIPMAAMVMLSITVFMVGVVNVYKISRAKLKAQNMADAVALYIGSQMTQAMNHVADRNEWLNIMYGNAANPNSTSADSDPCDVPKDSPPGIGCFAVKGSSAYKFNDKQAVQSYARLILTINQIQQLFSNSYNILLGVPGTVSNGQSSLYTNLLRNIPALNDPGVQLVIYNSKETKDIADDAAQHALQSPTTQNSTQNNMLLNNLQGLRFEGQSIKVDYCASPIAAVCDKKTISLEDALGVTTQKIGYMDLSKPQTAGSQKTAYLDTDGSIGAGAIVTVQVTLLGLKTTHVQARATAYVVKGAGSLTPDAKGRFSPTFWVKLGIPL